MVGAQLEPAGHQGAEAPELGLCSFEVVKVVDQKAPDEAGPGAEKKDDLPIPAIAGGAGGGVVVLSIAFWYYRHMLRRVHRNNRVADSDSETGRGGGRDVVNDPEAGGAGLLPGASPGAF